MQRLVLVSVFLGAVVVVAAVCDRSAAQPDPRSLPATAMERHAKEAGDTAVSPGGPGRVLYVSSTGDDSNVGSRQSPLRTIQRAANLLNPGDTVVVEDGVYTASGRSSCSGNPVLCISRGGTPAAWVTFRAEHPGGARLYGQDDVSAFGVAFAGGAYVNIDGFEIAGFGPNTSSASAAGITMQQTHDVVLSRLDIHDIGRACTDTVYGMAGIFARVPHVTITRSVIHDVGRFSPGEQGCRPGRPYYEANDHGIYVDGQPADNTPGASDVQITNNVLYRLQHGWPIHLYPGSLADVRIVNNTFAFQNPNRDGQVLIGANTSNLLIANNIFFQPRGAAIAFVRGSHSNLTVRNNLVSAGPLLGNPSSGATPSANISGDPLFVNATRDPYDFHLKPGSPAIGAGMPLPFVTVDCSGAPRVGAIDIGAYQAGHVKSQAARCPTSDLTFGSGLRISSSSGVSVARRNRSSRSAIRARS